MRRSTKSILILNLNKMKEEVLYYNQNGQPIVMRKCESCEEETEMLKQQKYCKPCSDLLKKERVLARYHKKK